MPEVNSSETDTFHHTSLTMWERLRIIRFWARGETLASKMNNFGRPSICQNSSDTNITGVQFVYRDR